MEDYYYIYMSMTMITERLSDPVSVENFPMQREPIKNFSIKRKSHVKLLLSASDICVIVFIIYIIHRFI